MNLIFLLDSNIISEPMKPRPSAKVMANLLHNAGKMSTATVVWHELLFGLHRLQPSRKREELEQYFQTEVKAKLPFLPYDEAAAEWHALERARLTKLGKPPSFVDSQIAAIAKVNQLILVTNNVSDYANFNDLQIENWYS
ncbi:twitching motility protein PilT [Scytonema hofmannii PCC 7110]|uniref:Twitching motility protein PilT n=1 Tax=Scytonema hofmannii PCC 7110 TaxID=128403 RepID=A0A139WTK9_9CYAN|nr:type II toxin-antitoxin system VapC family toxin [Scytonema hofmannii]KYC35766.1 twitching motility protein PilT [Scytonema hofmannii PCC 7110]